jgi:molecular chaperone HscB
MRAAYFCSSCGKVQPPAPTDYFSFFGLPRHLGLDLAALEREMLALSRRLHPDLYARASAQEQDWSLQQTSKLNNAYRILRDPIQRTEYLLRLEGAKPGEAPKLAGESAPARAAQKPTVPADLLEEVFELNLQLEEYRAGKKSGNEDCALRRELESASGNFATKLHTLAGELKGGWQEWDAIVDSESAGESVPPPARRRILDRLADVLHRRRYFANIIDEISAALNES